MRIYFHLLLYCREKISNKTQINKKKKKKKKQNNRELRSERHTVLGNVISYHGPGLVNMSGVSVTNVRSFMGCVAIINTPISSA